MFSLSTTSIGRIAVSSAVFLQAIGKVAFGTWLADFPSALFVLISFTLTAVFFLSLSRKGVGELAWGPVALLNISTALTFLCFFYALKLIEPAIVGAVEIGIGPVLAVIITLMLSGVRPTRLRILVCVGILAGCGVLAVAAKQGTGFAVVGANAWYGLGASAAAGLGAVLITMASKSLLGRGWKFGAVLAHRFYLILPVSLILALGSDFSGIEWSAGLMVSLIFVSLVGVLTPLYLLQVGIGRCDPYTVMVTMAALPVITFILEGFSPVYRRTTMGVSPWRAHWRFSRIGSLDVSRTDVGGRGQGADRFEEPSARSIAGGQETSSYERLHFELKTSIGTEQLTAS